MSATDHMIPLGDPIAAAMAASTDLDFDMPESLVWDQYPRVIRDIGKHILKLRIEQHKVERQMEAFEYQIRAKDWKGMGSNNDERSARLKLLLASEPDYQRMDQRYWELDWAIKRNDLELQGLENEFKAKRLKFRAMVVQSELFGGLPIDGTDADR